MTKIKNFDGEKLLEEVQSPGRTDEIRRMAHLVTYNPARPTHQPETYSVRITIEPDVIAQTPQLLTEHQQVKNFKRSTNRYFYHPEESHPPVEAHYHIIGPRGKEEIYSVTVSGKAHHQRHKGTEIPRREADELRKLGVNIGPDNLIERVDFNTEANQLLNESVNGTGDYVEVIVVIERD